MYLARRPRANCAANLIGPKTNIVNNVDIARALGRPPTCASVNALLDVPLLDV
jgi:hypothetical protein